MKTYSHTEIRDTSKSNSDILASYLLRVLLHFYLSCLLGQNISRYTLTAVDAPEKSKRNVVEALSYPMAIIYYIPH